MTLEQKTRDLVEMTENGHIIEAIDKYYADDVVILEATGETATGKEKQKERMHEWMASIEEMHDGGTHAIAADEDAGISMVESWVEATFKDMGRVKMEEVERYKWRDGKIAEARFYYNMPGS